MNEAAAAATIFYRQFLSELFAADLCRGRVQGHGGPRGDISSFLRPKKKEKDCNKTSPINLLLFLPFVNGEALEGKKGSK